MAFGAIEGLQGKKPQFWEDPIGNILNPGTPQYDPASSQLAGTSYNLFQQGSGLLYPAQNELVSYALNPNAPEQAAQQALGDVGQQFQQQDSARQRMYSLMGVTPTARESQALGQQENLSRAQAEAGAANAARRGTFQQQQGILG